MFSQILYLCWQTTPEQLVVSAKYRWHPALKPLYPWWIATSELFVILPKCPASIGKDIWPQSNRHRLPTQYLVRCFIQQHQLINCSGFHSIQTTTKTFTSPYKRQQRSLWIFCTSFHNRILLSLSFWSTSTHVLLISVILPVPVLRCCKCAILTSHFVQRSSKTASVISGLSQFIMPRDKRFGKSRYRSLL